MTMNREQETRCKRKARVYIAGPYTSPDPVLNTREAILWADKVWALGYTPFIPHLNHLWHFVSPAPYERWLELDIEWLKVCDCVFRFPGDSPGADKETKLAKELDIPVYTCLQALEDGQEVWV